MEKNQLGFLTTVYVSLLEFGIGIFALHPSWAGLAATLCMLPAVAISLAFPTKRTKVVAR